MTFQHLQREWTSVDTLLSFTTVRFHYVYCFVLDLRRSAPADVAERLQRAGFAQGIPNDRKGWLPTYRAESVITGQLYAYVDPHDLTTTAAEPPTTGSPHALIGNDGAVLPCTVCQLIRFRTTGSGTITITIDVRPPAEEPLSYLQLGHGIRLVPRTWDQSVQDEQTKGAGFSSRLALSRERPQDAVRLDDLFSSAAQHLLSILNQTDDERRVSAAPLFSQMFREDGAGGEIFRNVQVPYLFIDATIPEDLHTYYFAERVDNRDALAARRAGLVRQIAALLMRFFNLDKYDRISWEYVKREFALDGDNFVPMNINTDMFSYVHNAASLSICVDRREEPARFILPSLIDLLEASRLRWHTLMVANLNLDYLLARTASAPADEAPQSLSPTDSATSLTRMEVQVQRIRELVGLQLCDPHLYLHDGHVGFDLVALTYERFGIAKLSRWLTQKLSILDAVIRRRGYLDDLTPPPVSEPNPPPASGGSPTDEGADNAPPQAATDTSSDDVAGLQRQVLDRLRRGASA